MLIFTIDYLQFIFIGFIVYLNFLIHFNSVIIITDIIFFLNISVCYYFTLFFIFKNKFNARSRGWTEVCDQPAERPRIRLRKEHSVTLGDLTTWPGPRNNTWFSDMLTVSLANINISMNISTLSSIAEFSVDDAVSPCLPIQVNKASCVMNIFLFLICHVFFNISYYL